METDCRYNQVQFRPVYKTLQTIKTPLTYSAVMLYLMIFSLMKVNASMVKTTVQNHSGLKRRLSTRKFSLETGDAGIQSTTKTTTCLTQVFCSLRVHTVKVGFPSSFFDPLSLFCASQPRFK